MSVTFTKAGHGPLQVAIIKAEGVEMKDAGFCQNCFRPICPKCSGGTCEPYEKRIEREEREYRKLILP